MNSSLLHAMLATGGLRLPGSYPTDHPKFDVIREPVSQRDKDTQWLIRRPSDWSGYVQENITPYPVTQGGGANRREYMGELNSWRGWGLPDVESATTHADPRPARSLTGRYRNPQDIQDIPEY